MLKTLDGAYKAMQLRGQRLTPLMSFYMMTLGNARAVSLEGTIGSLAPGMDADLVVLDARATPQMAARMEATGSLSEELFVLQTCGDDRAIAETYVAGKAMKTGTAQAI
jgi:guanine deaminase